ncbi:acetate/propionate family kinase [Ornithinimicrobium pekingense]|uniref:Acetate kinase n=1 Tax=Ornithinimicrobium pekingense TaxID=384677 RepID=A0ABQ2FB97_9MICO|nr:acetate kinase [Ornithinimicrobium pekingense]GGK70880.1 acetate kinase [Ornithinimicrobium pekingense]
MTTAHTRRVLVVNAGSSSLKYQLVDPDTGRSDATGLVERIGLPAGRARHTCSSGTHVHELTVPDHARAMELLRDAFAEHGPDLAEVELVAVGHRVVHGGADFSEPTLITPAVVDAVRRLIPLAPLHNPGNLEGIEVAQRTFADVPQVAVFDTAFHQTMPAEASTYAVPRAWRLQHRVRRYGFHGTSHAYVSRRVAELLGRPVEEVRSVVLHLGNGASATAVDGGRSVDTSMGLTPLEGLVMGTRPGDLDPGLPRHLAEVAGISVEDYDRALSKESGLLGLTGSADMREVMERREAGDADAALAFDVVVHRLLHYVGGYAAVLGRLDALAFTAGIGEHSPEIRAAVLSRLAGFGVELDEAANASADGETLITTPGSSVAAFVVPTNEEWEIASQAAEVVGAG